MSESPHSPINPATDNPDRTLAILNGALVIAALLLPAPAVSIVCGFIGPISRLSDHSSDPIFVALVTLIYAGLGAALLFVPPLATASYTMARRLNAIPGRKRILMRVYPVIVVIWIGLVLVAALLIDNELAR